MLFRSRANFTGFPVPTQAGGAYDNFTADSDVTCFSPIVPFLVPGRIICDRIALGNLNQLDPNATHLGIKGMRVLARDGPYPKNPQNPGIAVTTDWVYGVSTIPFVCNAKMQDRRSNLFYPYSAADVVLNGQNCLSLLPALTNWALFTTTTVNTTNTNVNRDLAQAVLRDNVCNAWTAIGPVLPTQYNAMHVRLSCPGFMPQVTHWNNGNFVNNWIPMIISESVLGVSTVSMQSPLTWEVGAFTLSNLKIELADQNCQPAEDITSYTVQIQFTPKNALTSDVQAFYSNQPQGVYNKGQQLAQDTSPQFPVPPGQVAGGGAPPPATAAKPLATPPHPVTIFPNRNANAEFRPKRPHLFK